MALPGIGTFLGGIGALLAKLPIQGRKERWKNELDKLRKEKIELLRGQCDYKKSVRLNAVNARMSELSKLLENSSDSN